jgi:type IV secretory pathway VirD2 relaxase
MTNGRLHSESKRDPPIQSHAGEKPFRLRPRRPRGAPGQSERRWASGLRQLLKLSQSSAHRVRLSRTSFGPGRREFHWPANYQQRCAVRVTYSPNKTAGQWKAHGRYLARETATQDLQSEKPNQKFAAFDAKQAGIDIARCLNTWQREGDQRFFKLIVSPEFGERMDLASHTRDLLSRMERDLGTALEWAAVVHYNTDHPHVHIVLRGRDGRGQPVRLPREFIKSRIRNHAQELATKQLGYRTERDAIEGQRREISQLRFTSLDRIIQRNNPLREEAFLVQCHPSRPGLRDTTKARDHHFTARLSKLEQIGLATGLGGFRWKVRGDFEQLLRTLQRTTDRQRMLARHMELLSDPRLPLEFVSFRQLQRLEGRIIAHGQDEATDQPYLLLEGTDAKVHLLYQNDDIQNARHRGEMKTNSFVRLEKRFSNGKPFLQIDDLGDADQLLKNPDHFENAASKHAGNADVGHIWSGWLGKYHSALAQQLAKNTERARQAKEQDFER